jgi:4'-phosphopantetheinyl transferase
MMTQDTPAGDDNGPAPGRVDIFSLVVPGGFGELPIGRIGAARVLSPAELERFERYQLQRRRNDLVLSRIMLRMVWTRLGLGVAGGCGLVADVHGKPCLAPRAGRPALHLNTSDTTGMIIWAFSRAGPLGCDVELIGADKDAVAGSHFAPQELADYRRLPGTRKRDRFYELWTLKEAVLKADGRGLGIPLGSFSFRFAGPGTESPCALDVQDLRTGPPPGPWRFLGYKPTATHQAAVAVRTPDDVDFRRHLLHLEEFDAECVRPWKFTVARDRDSSTSAPQDVLFTPGS